MDGMINNAQKEETLFKINSKTKMDSIMYQDLLRFKKFLDDRKIKFRVVGSIALTICGLNLEREPEDIDVEVECTADEERIFRDLAEAYGSTYHNNDYSANSDRKPFIFKFGETIIDVWTYRNINDNSVYRDGIAFAPINDVLKKKLAYKRKKDFADLLSIIGNLSEMANK